MTHHSWWMQSSELWTLKFGALAKFVIYASNRIAIWHCVFFFWKIADSLFGLYCSSKWNNEKKWFPKLKIENKRASFRKFRCKFCLQLPSSRVDAWLRFQAISILNRFGVVTIFTKQWTPVPTINIDVDVSIVGVDDTRRLFDDFGWAGWVRGMNRGGVLVNRV